MLPKLTYIGAGAFQSSGLEKIELNSINYLESLLQYGGQFENCTKLTHVTMKNINFVQSYLFYRVFDKSLVSRRRLKTIKQFYYRNNCYLM